jgi:hypothetical protein
VAELDARMYGGMEPLRVAAEPGPLNPLRWRGIVETGPFYEVFDVNLLAEFDPAGGRIFYKAEPDPRQAAAAAAARKTEAFRAFLDFSQYPYWRFSDLDKPQNGVLVEATDLRFGTPARPGFVASAVVDSAGRVVESGFSYRGRR